MQYIVPSYIFREKAFTENYIKFVKSFTDEYPQYRLAYSYKTNYTPYICSLVKKLGGYAEVVSEMEYNLAKRIGYSDSQIIFNGPDKESFPNCILNIDSIEELKKCTTNRIGIRVNIGIGQSYVSKFAKIYIDK